MKIDTVRAETVAMLTQQIIKRKCDSMQLDESDFTTFSIPGSKWTYRHRTYVDAAKEAWEMIQAVEEVRPQD